MDYPYQRLALACGCHEIVTGPGAVDEFCCPTHDTQDGSSALVQARLDAFTFQLANPLPGEREACAKIAEEFVDWDAGIAVYTVSQEIAAAIRARRAANEG